MTKWNLFNKFNSVAWIQLQTSEWYKTVDVESTTEILTEAALWPFCFTFNWRYHRRLGRSASISFLYGRRQHDRLGLSFFCRSSCDTLLLRYLPSTIIQICSWLFLHCVPFEECYNEISWCSYSIHTFINPISCISSSISFLFNIPNVSLTEACSTQGDLNPDYETADWVHNSPRRVFSNFTHITCS